MKEFEFSETVHITKNDYLEFYGRNLRFNFKFKHILILGLGIVSLFYTYTMIFGMILILLLLVSFLIPGITYRSKFFTEGYDRLTYLHYPMSITITNESISLKSEILETTFKWNLIHSWDRSNKYLQIQFVGMPAVFLSIENLKKERILTKVIDHTKMCLKLK